MDRVDLIKRCQLGDLNSFEQLYRLYNKNAMGTAYLIAKHKGIAEDIVQEAFLQCYKEIKNLKDPNTFDVWFYKLLVRLAWKLSAKHQKIIPVEVFDSEIIFYGDSDKTEQGFAETKLIVHEAVEKLSPPLKTVIILYYFNDMTIKQISIVLGCFEGTVKSRLHNAKKLLQKNLCDIESEVSHLNMCMVKECKDNG